MLHTNKTYLFMLSFVFSSRPFVWGWYAAVTLLSIFIKLQSLELSFKEKRKLFFKNNHTKPLAWQLLGTLWPSIYLKRYGKVNLTLTSLTNSLPWSDKIRFGQPCLYMIEHNWWATSAALLLFNGKASTHFEK